jgi:hypothetical protein
MLLAVSVAHTGAARKEPEARRSRAHWLRIFRTTRTDRALG